MLLEPARRPLAVESGVLGLGSVVVHGKQRLDSSIGAASCLAREICQGPSVVEAARLHHVDDELLTRRKGRNRRLRPGQGIAWTVGQGSCTVDGPIGRCPVRQHEELLLVRPGGIGRVFEVVVDPFIGEQPLDEGEIGLVVLQAVGSRLLTSRHSPLESDRGLCKHALDDRHGDFRLEDPRSGSASKKPKPWDDANGEPVNPSCRVGTPVAH
jgi:hypothetical protein